MARDVPGGHPEAADADIQEQDRLPIDEGFDPEQPAGTVPPDVASAEADPADVQEQSVEVPDEDDYPPE